MNFDRLAPHYDWLEALTAGARLQRVRTQWLESLRGKRRILSVGEGHGRFAEACVGRFPESELTCVELSGGMLARAKKRVASSAGSVHWVQADVLEWQAAEKFDAIVTCFFLDCFTPATLEAVVAKLADAAGEQAVWLIADFAVPVRGPSRWRALGVHALMYAFFRAFVSLPARRLSTPDALLGRHGFRLEARREFEWGLLRADLWRRLPSGERR